MKIALVAHGRFHAFDFARELCRQGHDVRLVTNYPIDYVERWGVPRQAIVTFVRHGAASRVSHKLGKLAGRLDAERRLHEWFGRAAERAVASESWDVLLCWSGVGEEILTSSRVSGLRVCHRSSTHIRTQDRLLDEEGERVGLEIERPSPWMIAREEREYASADLILVPSRFVVNSFVERGTPRERLRMVPLGVDPELFRPTADVVEARRQRILSGAPLSVAYVGPLSPRKGLRDLVDIAGTLASSGFEFHCTGPVPADAGALVTELARHATVHPARPQRDLPATYAGADLFLFPTIEDGYGMVVSQAMAAALPILCTTNCCGSDIVTDDVTGWVLPARRSDLFIERLRWCADHRDRLAEMIADAYARFTPWTWADSTRSLVEQLAA